MSDVSVVNTMSTVASVLTMTTGSARRYLLKPSLNACLVRTNGLDAAIVEPTATAALHVSNLTSTIHVTGAIPVVLAGAGWAVVSGVKEVPNVLKDGSLEWIGPSTIYPVNEGQKLSKVKPRYHTTYNLLQI